MTRFRFSWGEWTGPTDRLYQALLCFGIGALLGLIFWADTALSPSTVDELVYALPAVRGFWWNVLGDGALALIIWALCVLGQRVSRGRA